MHSSRLHLTLSHYMIHHFSIKAYNLPSDPSHQQFIWMQRWTECRTATGSRWRWFSSPSLNHPVACSAIQFDFLILFYFLFSFLGIRNNSIHQSIEYLNGVLVSCVGQSARQRTQLHCALFFLFDFVGAVQIQFPFYITLVWISKPFSVKMNVREPGCGIWEASTIDDSPLRVYALLLANNFVSSHTCVRAIQCRFIFM